MQKVTSKDGTEIAFEKSGNGPALIIVGGSLADHLFYAPLADELAKHFMVYVFDRRGRGQSGDTGAYAVEREIEDVAALIDFAKEPVCMYGHSAGSALALRAAASGEYNKSSPCRSSVYTQGAEMTRRPKLNSLRKPRA
jgi:alpha-beta hydrolase superfamily lysophospholipase